VKQDKQLEAEEQLEHKGMVLEHNRHSVEETK
jgi:hypothetical protein